MGVPGYAGTLYSLVGLLPFLQEALFFYVFKLFLKNFAYGASFVMSMIQVNNFKLHYLEETFQNRSFFHEV